MVLEDEGWRTPESSLLDLEEEDDGKIFHINIIMEESEQDREAASPYCPADED